MKKYVLSFTAALVLLAACNEEKKAAREERKISKRNYEITPQISFNDLFLDSLDVVQFIDGNGIPDSIARRIISFYNTRNYGYAWFSSDGVAEHTMGFTSLLNFSKDTSREVKDIKKLIDGLLLEKEVKLTEKNERVRNAEIELTKQLITYTKENFERGYVPRREVEHFVPVKKENPLEMADSILKAIKKEKKDFSEVNEQYARLAVQLQKYRVLAQDSQWLRVEEATFKKGEQNPSIAAAKNNLFLTGDLPVADSTPVYTPELEHAIRNFQTRYGMNPDGKAGPWFFEHINITPQQRIEQLLINMFRMRWLPEKPNGRLILVNTPAFTLKVLEDGKEVFSMPVVVGKEGHNTVLFSDKLSTIVFSPYWNIPKSIVKSEILPAMENNPNYLETHNMEIVKETEGIPVIRQKPGPKNSLGKVKFLFPNSFNIYFHDTPAKSLFNKDVRAYSHGCIRLAEPKHLASYLLNDQPKWSNARIEAAMNSGEEQYVKLEDPVPVFITYYTAWVDDGGVLHFRDDIYAHDRDVGKRLFY